MTDSCSDRVAEDYREGGEGKNINALHQNYFIIMGHGQQD